MLCVLHSPLLLLTSLMTALNLNLNPVPGLTLICGIEKSSMQDKGAPEVLEYAVIKYNENHRDLHLNWFVEVTMSKRRCVTLEVRELCARSQLRSMESGWETSCWLLTDPDYRQTLGGSGRGLQACPHNRSTPLGQCLPCRLAESCGAQDL